MIEAHRDAEHRYVLRLERRRRGAGSDAPSPFADSH